MRYQFVYDLPTRVFHGIFALLFVFAFMIAKTLDDESPQYAYHMLAGLLLAFTVLLRLLWGLVGTRYARFSSFALSPRELGAYFLGILQGDRRRWAGHNPASSWAALLMFGLALALAATGVLMSLGQKKPLKDVHEILANAFLILVLLHIAGVLLHSLRHRDALPLSMVDGAKAGVLPANSSPIGSKPLVALLFVGLVGGFAWQLATHFNPQTQSLNVFGLSLQLGEAEPEPSSAKAVEGTTGEKIRFGDDDGEEEDYR